MTVPDATPEADEPVYTIVVHAVGLTGAALDALFERVADAAHDLREDVACFGGYDVEAKIRAEALREALAEIDTRVMAAIDEVKGADFGTVLVATTEAYSGACRDLASRIEDLP